MKRDTALGEVDGSADRPLRRDAAENRERLLRAAADVFAEHGLDVNVNEVARRAGLGTGTLYRRFPTKEALIDELAVVVVTEMAEIGRALARAKGSEVPLHEFLRRCGERLAARRSALPPFWRAPLPADALTELRRAVSALVESARRSGAVRDDLHTSDVMVLLWSLQLIIQAVGAVDPDAWRRQLEITWHGFTAPGPPLAHPPLELGQLDVVNVHRGSGRSGRRTRPR